MLVEKNSVILYKSGKFYNAYGDNGIIIHNLLGYKFVSYKNSAGFPESAINKVKGVLEKEKLSYVIYEKNTFIEHRRIVRALLLERCARNLPRR